MSNSQPKVCVLLAVYNGEMFLKQQVHSILYQCDVACDIFASLDLSDDRSNDIIRGFSRKFDNVHIVSEGIRFGSAAKNFYNLIKKVNISGYDYVCFSDQDDIWFPDKISNAITTLRASGASGFSSDVYAFWPGNGKFSRIRKSRAMTVLDHFFESPGPGCSQVFTRDSFIRFQLFYSANETLFANFDYHDWLIYAFYKESNLRWVISDIPGMLYVQHSQNQIGANSSLSASVRRFGMIRSKWYRSQVLILAEVFCRPEILSGQFMIRNVFRLRRSKVQAVIVLLIFVFGFM